jgi:cholesterol oxidase
MRAWSSLPAPTLDDVVGELRAEFVAPLRHVAPVGLGLVGLPRWHGKRFAESGPGELAGVNLVRARDGSGSLEERLPMRAVSGVGSADGRPAVVVTYPGNGPRPWRWVRDELRVGSDGVLVGMSYVDRPLLRCCGLPFLLHRQQQVDPGPGRHST